MDMGNSNISNAPLVPEPPIGQQWPGEHWPGAWPGRRALDAWPGDRS